MNPFSPILDAIEAKAATSPDAVAVMTRDQRLSYRELCERAEHIALALRLRGVAKGDMVAVLAERCRDLVPSVLAIWWLGGIFVPLDPSYPPARRQFMLGDAGARCCLDLRERDGAAGADEAISLADLLQSSQREPIPRAALSSEDPAYLIYTSGTTGRPKGVLVPHRGMPHLARAQAEVFRVDARSRVLQFASPSFDAFISELVVTLAAGAALCIPAPGDRSSVRSLRQFIAHCEVTMGTFPPSILDLMDPQDFPTLETVVSAGESCPPSIAERWCSKVHFVNAYGPTEVTVCATMAVCRPGDPTPLPIGHAIAGARLSVVDDTLAPVPRGGQGELLVGGAGLALGYWRRPEETQRRFVDDPGRPGHKAYRTGDLVRERADGQLEFLGRIDDQVKIAGHRIEPLEIKAHIEALAGVDACEVLVDDSSGSKRLVAFVKTTLRNAEREVLSACAATLPAYMVPEQVIAVTAWPTLHNGKVDRGALLQLARVPAVVPSSHETKLESGIADEWSRALGVGRTDGEFWELGGTSLKLMALLARIERRFGVAIAPARLFAQPLTVARLTQMIQRPESCGGWDGGLVLNESGEDTLFLIPPVSGDPFGMLNLARALSVRRRVVCLASKGWFAGEPATTLEEAAEYYLNQAARFMTGSRAVIIGYSVGAVHGLELARQLARSGRESLLITIDGPVPFTGPRPDVVTKLGEFASPYMAFHISRMLGATQGKATHLEIEQLIKLDERGVEDALHRELMRLGVLGAESSIEDASRRLRVFRNNLRGKILYLGQPYRGAVRHIRSADGHPFDPLNKALFDWTPILGEYVFRVVPGGHFGVLDSDHAPAVARVVEELVEEAPRSEPLR